MTLNGKELLQYLQTPPSLILEGWSKTVRVYAGVCNLSSPVGVVESRYVCDQ